MAQTGFTPISNYYSATATNVPTAGNLVAGELAINTADGKLFYKDSGGVVQTLATKTAATFPNVNGSTSGAVTLAAPAVAGSNTATFPAATGTVMVSGNMPAISYYSTSGQAMTANAFTRIVFNTKEFDTTASSFNTSTGTFTPTIAGYYQFSASAQFLSVTGYTTLAFYKNGSNVRQGTYPNVTAGQSNGSTVSSLIYCNGSTDYIEVYGYHTNATNVNLSTSANSVWFTGAMIRSA